MEEMRGIGMLTQKPHDIMLDRLREREQLLFIGSLEVMQDMLEL